MNFRQMKRSTNTFDQTKNADGCALYDRTNPAETRRASPLVSDPGPIGLCGYKMNRSPDDVRVA